MIRRSVDFPFCNDRLTVFQFEGTVQLILYQDGWPQGPRKVAGNLFCGPETAQELRAIADHVDELFGSVASQETPELPA